MRFTAALEPNGSSSEHGLSAGVALGLTQELYGCRRTVLGMGFMSKILGGRDERSTEDYVQLDVGDFDAAVSGDAAMQVHIAEVEGQADAIDIKDAVYDGDLVIADITRLRTEDRTVEHIVDELRQVAEEVGGDIVQKGDDQLIVTPTGVQISREKLGQP